MCRMIACGLRLFRCQRVVELTDISRKYKGRQLTHAFMFNGNALLILPLEGVSKEANRKVHCRRPHAVSVRGFIRAILADLEISRRTETRS